MAAQGQANNNSNELPKPSVQDPKINHAKWIQQQVNGRNINEWKQIKTKVKPIASNYRIPVISNDDELNDLYSNGDYIVCRCDNGDCSHPVYTVSGGNYAAAKNHLKRYHADDPTWKQYNEKKKTSG